MKKIWVLIVFVLLGLTGCSSKPEISDYLSYDIRGVNRYASLHGSIDSFNLSKEALKLKNGALDEPKSETLAALLMFDVTLDYDATKFENLQNGDEITINFTVVDRLKSKVKTSPLKIKVENLDEKDTVNANDN